jgi:uncharacterized protein (TIGR04255 family)
MMARQPLVTYEQPPLIEVVIGVQFERLATLDAAHLGLLWGRFRDRFPKSEQKPPLDSAIERLGMRGQVGQARLELLTDVRPRLWFMNESEDELVQVQDDRFIRNWRRTPAEDRTYPRFDDTLLPRFKEDFSAFQAFLEAERVGPIEANQCEVTYVNHIAVNENWSSHSDLAKVFRGWSTEYGEQIEWPIETVQVKVAHVLRDDKNEFVGRLHVAIEPTFTLGQGSPSSPVPAFRLTLTARGRPIGPGDAGITAFLDLGHRAVVTSFDKMVTHGMQRIWGRA